MEIESVSAYVSRTHRLIDRLIDQKRGKAVERERDRRQERNKETQVDRESKKGKERARRWGEGGK